MNIIEPGESKKVTASSDPIGLKVAVVYDAAPEGQQLLYHRWQCKNESVLTVTYMNGAEISTFGGDLLWLLFKEVFIIIFCFLIDDTTSQGKGKIREGDESKFAAAIEALTYQPPITRTKR